MHIGIDRKTHGRIAAKIVAASVDERILESELTVMRSLTQSNHQPTQEATTERSAGAEHIIKLLDAFVEPALARDGTATKGSSPPTVVVMECASGGDLFAKVLAEGGFSEPTAGFYFRQIALGLAAMHANHITHRDVKLENVMVR
eukprot:SAG11_NODE_295_length_11115_cov_14.005264_7_plen_145_part_00